MFNEVLDIPDMVGDWPTSGLMILDNSFGTPYDNTPAGNHGPETGTKFMDFR